MERMNGQTREERILELQSQIDAGTYSIDLDTLADIIAEFISEEPVSTDDFEPAALVG